MTCGETLRRLAVILAIAGATPALLWFDTANSQTEVRFDHFTTGFRLEGTHRFADCESCHVNGIFEGTPTDCADCHSQASLVRATYQPPTHLPVSTRCDGCHRENVWDVVMRVDHLEVKGSCSSCHNNRVVAGQPPQHIPTTAECDSCHNTRWWR